MGKTQDNPDGKTPRDEGQQSFKAYQNNINQISQLSRLTRSVAMGATCKEANAELDS